MFTCILRFNECCRLKHYTTHSSISIFRLRCRPCPILWCWQQQPMSNTGPAPALLGRENNASPPVLCVNASQATLIDISLHTFRPWHNFATDGPSLAWGIHSLGRPSVAWGCHYTSCGPTSTHVLWALCGVVADTTAADNTVVLARFL